MSNLEDVFLKINKKYAPELFEDLKGLGSSQISSSFTSADASGMSSNDAGVSYAKSIGHSTMTDAS